MSWDWIIYTNFVNFLECNRLKLSLSFKVFLDLMNIVFIISCKSYKYSCCIRGLFPVNLGMAGLFSLKPQVLFFLFSVFIHFLSLCFNGSKH